MVKHHDQHADEKGVTALEDYQYSGRVARNSLLNILGVILPAVVALIATPIILANLGPKGFGVFSIQLAVLVLIGVNDFGVSRAVTLEAVARGGFQSASELAKVVWAGTHLITTVAISILIIGALILIAAVVALSMTADEWASWGLLLLASALSLVTLPARAALEVQERFAMLNAIRIVGSSLLFAAPTAAALIEPTMTASSIALLLSRIAVSAATVVATRRLLARPSCAEFSGAVLSVLTGRASELHKQLIQRGGWLGSAGIASSLIGYADRFALGIAASATMAANYVVASELVTKMWLVSGAMAAAFMPRLAHHWRDPDRTKFRRIFYLLFGTLLLISFASHVIFTFFGTWFMKAWLGNTFSNDMPQYLAILSIGISINLFCGPNYLILLLTRRERTAANVQFLTLPLTIIASLTAARLFGPTGVAWVFAIRLILDAFIIRILVAQNEVNDRLGISHASILLYTTALIFIYLIAL